MWFRLLSSSYWTLAFWLDVLDTQVIDSVCKDTPQLCGVDGDDWQESAVGSREGPQGGAGIPYLYCDPSPGVDPVQPCRVPCTVKMVIIDPCATFPSLTPPFPPRWRAYLVKLCCRCIAEGVDHWLGILPILHYCMQLSPPRRASKSQSEDTWAGLEGICFAQFREEAPTR